jgi:hypothetical protein
VHLVGFIVKNIISHMEQTQFTGTQKFRDHFMIYLLQLNLYPAYGHASLNDGNTFLISNFHRVLYVVCFLLGNSPASEFYIPTFRITLFHLHRSIGAYPPMMMEQTECSETSAYKIQTSGNYPEENIPDGNTF